MKLLIFRWFYKKTEDCKMVPNYRFFSSKETERCEMKEAIAHFNSFLKYMEQSGKLEDFEKSFDIIMSGLEDYYKEKLNVSILDEADKIFFTEFGIDLQECDSYEELQDKMSRWIDENDKVSIETVFFKIISRYKDK